MAIVCIELSSTGLTNEENEFFVGFFRNSFGLVSEQESIDPVLWITTSESTPVSFNVSQLKRLVHQIKTEKTAWDLGDLPVTMLTNIGDCGFLSLKVKLYCFQGSIQLRVVKIPSMLD